ncbi:hypothetical protein BC952_1216 [Flavobacterium limicola]|uniref:Uncharacterized protein n=1 Tax=Flavobacterium limicola TaxID=180441 RepID=A0A495S8N8_9FLAO|nr:hypothetical protein [Flavobacterium limicola]RKS95526.1 hypothetical protein BC952_1216 [Flavobacterium limicola]
MKNIKLLLGVLFLFVFQASAATVNYGNKELIAHMSVDEDVISLFENSSRTVIINYFASQGSVKLTDEQQIKINALKLQNEQYRLNINQKYPAYAGMNIEEQQKIMYTIGANGLAAASGARVMTCTSGFLYGAAKCTGDVGSLLVSSWKTLKAAGCFVAAVSGAAVEEIASEGMATGIVAAEAAPVLEGCWSMAGFDFLTQLLVTGACYTGAVAALLVCI